MSFAIGGLLLTLLTFGYLPSETLIPAALVVIGSPLAIWQIRRINRLIYDYEHAYDDTQAPNSDEGRPTDQPT